MRYAPTLEVKRSANLIRLGTDYGGWTFEQSADLENATIVSCGLGEDASFDVEFTTRFKARIIIVDPTPRAIDHFEAIQKRLGQPASETSASMGEIPPGAYDLSKLYIGSLLLEPYALWVENTKLKFYEPRNPAHVSRSIINYQNNYSETTPYIEVGTITPEGLLAKYQIGTIPLMKLDIEGAEINVIRHMLDKSIRPRQILVEFDEMNAPSARGKKNIEHTDSTLRQAGYLCRYFDGRANALYVLS